MEKHYADIADIDLAKESILYEYRYVDAILRSMSTVEELLDDQVDDNEHIIQLLIQVLSKMCRYNSLRLTVANEPHLLEHLPLVDYPSQGINEFEIIADQLEWAEQRLDSAIRVRDYIWKSKRREAERLGCNPQGT